jgi:co-chaperonin GroES (HSP10)
MENTPPAWESGIILPPSITPAPAPEAEHLTDEQFDAALPKPSGHKLLVALPQVDETYEGGIIKVADTMHAESVTSPIALVVDMGPSAYKDLTRFPDGPWCKVGDYVILGPYKGNRFKLDGKEFRIINDDTVDGVCVDPRGYRRI